MSVMALWAWQPVGAQHECSFSVINDTSIKPAVDAWIYIGTRDEAEATYGGHISQWNISCVTTMKDLFKFVTNFKEDLSAWDTRRLKYLDLAFEATSNFQSNMLSLIHI